MLKDNKKEIWDAFYLIALQGFNYVAPLIVFPYLMYVLGAEKFGYIGFSLSIVSYFMLLVDFGFNLSATKRIAISKDNPDELNKIISSTIIAKVGLLIIGFILLLIIAFAIPQFRIYSSTMLILYLMVVANTFTFIWLFQGLGKIRLISIVNIISKLLILPLTFFLVKAPGDYLIAATIQSSVYILSSIISVAILFKQKLITNWVIVTKDQIIKELKFGFPIFISTTASSIYTTLFAVILGYFSTPTEVGKYTAAEKIMRAFCYLFLMPTIQSFYPKISSMSQSNKLKAINKVNAIAISLSVVMIFVFIILYFFSEQLTKLLGNDYEGSKLIFQIMAILPLTISIGGVLGQLGILAIGNELDKKKFQNIYLLGAGMAIISIFALVPHFHAVGASIALLITELSVLFGMGWSYMRLVK